MADTNELQAAVERLRRVKAGEDAIEVYRTATRFGRVAFNSEWTIHDAHGLADTMMAEDHETLADAYLKLGTRQPDELVIETADGNYLECSGEPFAEVASSRIAQPHKVVRIVAFKEVLREVPDVERN